MALSADEKATTIARAGAGRMGSMRAGYAPVDIDPTNAAQSMWHESGASGGPTLAPPLTTSWTSNRT